MSNDKERAIFTVCHRVENIIIREILMDYLLTCELPTNNADKFELYMELASQLAARCAELLGFIATLTYYLRYQ